MRYTIQYPDIPIFLILKDLDSNGKTQETRNSKIPESNVRIDIDILQMIALAPIKVTAALAMRQFDRT